MIKVVLKDMNKTKKAPIFNQKVGVCVIHECVLYTNCITIVNKKVGVRVIH